MGRHPPFCSWNKATSLFPLFRPNVSLIFIRGLLANWSTLSRYQWRIQDFPNVGGNPWVWGENLLFGKIFAENCRRKKEIGPGGASLAPRLDPAMTWVLLRRDRDRDILARLRFGHQRPLNRRCPDEKYQYVNNNRLTEYPGTPAWTPADTRDLLVAGVQAGLDTSDLVVAGVRISISPKYLYLYLELSGSTAMTMNDCGIKENLAPRSATTKWSGTEFWGDFKELTNVSKKQRNNRKRNRREFDCCHLFRNKNQT